MNRWDREDPLAAPRGIANGLLLVVFLWLVIFLVMALT